MVERVKHLSNNCKKSGFSRQLFLLDDNNQQANREIVQFCQNNEHQSGLYLSAQANTLYQQLKTLSITRTLFQHSRNLLGQEFQFVIIDFRDERGDINFHLESLAITASTLCAGGYLILIAPEWRHLKEYKDWDSIRWSGSSTPIIPRYFYQWFQHSLAKFPQSLCHNVHHVDKLPMLNNKRWQTPVQATEHQQKIIQQIINSNYAISLLSAARGRGKSSLLGQLAKKLIEEFQVDISICAANRRAVQRIFDYLPQEKLHFISPDNLIKQIESGVNLQTNHWLLVDEAAMIPIPMLQKMSNAFSRAVFSTTVHAYEGTGKGFELKFTRLLTREYQTFKLSLPLRWQEDDALETWITELLLLDDQSCKQRAVEEHSFKDSAPLLLSKVEPSQLFNLSAKESEFAQFYSLLSSAHYRTSPLNLRRLCDAPKQSLWQGKFENYLYGAIWAIEEGAIQDNALINAIWRGERRPPGNLFIQSLCYQGDIKQACRLHSLRISRIALFDTMQNKGYGSQLLQQFMTAVYEEGKYDFISVSFGYSEKLCRFWLKNGFRIVHVSSHQEASSANYSIMAIHPISKSGNSLAFEAENKFLRNFLMLNHPLTPLLKQHIDFPNIDYSITPFDLQKIADFLQYNRPLLSTLPSIKRVLYHDDSAENYTLQYELESSLFHQLSKPNQLLIDRIYKYLK